MSGTSSSPSASRRLLQRTARRHERLGHRRRGAPSRRGERRRALRRTAQAVHVCRRAARPSDNRRTRRHLGSHVSGVEGAELMLPLLLEASGTSTIASSPSRRRPSSPCWRRSCGPPDGPVVPSSASTTTSSSRTTTGPGARQGSLWDHFADDVDRSTERVLPRIELSEGRVFEGKASARRGGVRSGRRDREDRSPLAVTAEPSTRPDRRAHRRLRSVPRRA